MKGVIATVIICITILFFGFKSAYSYDDYETYGTIVDSQLVGHQYNSTQKYVTIEDKTTGKRITMSGIGIDELIIGDEVNIKYRAYHNGIIESREVIFIN